VKIARKAANRQLSYHRSVRVHGNEIDVDGIKWLHVDVVDDGIAEGYCLASDFVGGIRDMPDFQTSDYKRMPEEYRA